MADPAQGVAGVLVAAGIGTFGALTGWGIFVGRFPDENDTAILVNRSGGKNPWPHIRLDFPSISVMIRGGQSGYVAAEAKARAVKDALLGYYSDDVNGDRWMGLTQIGDIGFLGFDENHRPLFSANFALIIEEASGTYRRAIS